MKVFGYEVDEVVIPTERANESVFEIHLGGEGGDVILTADEFHSVVRNSGTPEDFATGVMRAKGESEQRWKRERGPDSELGRNMEAETPSSTREE